MLAGLWSVALIVVVFAVVVIYAIHKCAQGDIESVIKAFATWIWPPARRESESRPPPLTDHAPFSQVVELLNEARQVGAARDASGIEAGNPEGPSDPGDSD